MLCLKKGTQFCDVYVRLHIYHYKWNIWILVNSKYFCFECFIEQINVTVIGWAQKGCLCELNTFVTVAQVLKSGELILHPLWWASIRKGGGPSNTAAIIWYCCCCWCHLLRCLVPMPQHLVGRDINYGTAKQHGTDATWFGTAKQYCCRHTICDVPYASSDTAADAICCFSWYWISTTDAT